MLTVKLSNKEDLKNLRNKGRRIVHCHGCFDVLHIGHIRYLQAAREMGDILIVSVTSDKYVNKGPNRPIFTAEERSEALCALQCVDYVIINDAPESIELIGLMKPHIYVKGSEYKNKENIDFNMVKSLGGKVAFTNTKEFHTTDLIKRMKQC
jgi:rfaE bifunctional protein nucleotidyltransferase chain/domain